MSREQSSRSIRPAGSPDPVVEAYKRDVDRTLLREQLRKGVEERLEDLQRLYDLSQELHRAGDRLRHR